MALKVSNSRAKTWRRCKLQHHYKYNLNLRKKVPSVALFRGKIIHEMVEAFIEDRDWRDVLDEYLEEYDNLFEEEKEEYGDLPNELPRIMEGYVERYKDDTLEPIEFEGQLSEHEFEVDLIPKYNIKLTGRLDRVVKSQNNSIWLTETKTHKSIPNDEGMFTDIQTAIYTWAMPKMGLPKPDGVLWDYIRTKPPKEPKVLKSGELTRRKSIDTTKRVYREALEDQGLDPEDYQDMLDRLEGNESKFYRRVYMPTSDKLVNKLVTDFMNTALEIFMLGGKLKTRNIAWDCNWRCDYFQLCEAGLKGMDTEYLIDKNYEVRD